MTQEDFFTQSLRQNQLVLAQSSIFGVTTGYWLPWQPDIERQPRFACDQGPPSACPRPGNSVLKAPTL
jgi:hypothetical protein